MAAAAEIVDADHADRAGHPDRANRPHRRLTNGGSEMLQRDARFPERERRIKTLLSTSTSVHWLHQSVMANMRFQKFFPLDRPYPIFELVDGSDVLLDISKRQDGVIEIAFHGSIGSRILALDQFEELLEIGTELARSSAKG